MSRGGKGDILVSNLLDSFQLFVLTGSHLRSHKPFLFTTTPLHQRHLLPELFTLLASSLLLRKPSCVARQTTRRSERRFVANGRPKFKRTKVCLSLPAPTATAQNKGIQRERLLLKIHNKSLLQPNESQASAILASALELLRSIERLVSSGSVFQTWIFIRKL